MDDFGELAYLNPLKSAGNALLVRPVIGQVRQPTMPLPPADHAYGFTQKKDVEGAGKVVNGWCFHQPSKRGAAGRDFILLNKMAMESGTTDAKGIKEFRATHDARQRVGPLRKRKDLKGNFAPPSEKGFGLPSPERPETVRDIVSGTFQREWVQKRRAVYAQQKAERAEARQKSVAPPATKASLGHARKQEAEPAAELAKTFKMKRFVGVKSKIGEIIRGGKGEGSTAAAAAAGEAAAAEEEQGEPSSPAI